MRFAFLCLLFLFIFIGCTQKSDEPPFSIKPEIRFVKMNPQTVVAGRDSVTFQIEYQDGDGDLGDSTADAQNLFLTDTRINAVYPYRIPRIVPSDNKVPIKGSFTFSLPNTFLTDSVPSQQTTFTIRIRDRAGNDSNTLTTPTLMINKE
jgi:hypothetical protein